MCSGQPDFGRSSRGGLSCWLQPSTRAQQSDDSAANLGFASLARRMLVSVRFESDRLLGAASHLMGASLERGLCSAAQVRHAPDLLPRARRV